MIEGAGEAGIAGVKLDKGGLAREAVDLLCNLLVLNSANGGRPEDVYAHVYGLNPSAEGCLPARDGPGPGSRPKTGPSELRVGL